jgi:hypothetical protein
MRLLYNLWETVRRRKVNKVWVSCCQRGAENTYNTFQNCSYIVAPLVIYFGYISFGILNNANTFIRMSKRIKHIYTHNAN